MLNQQIGSYKIISQLGEGGMANVYLAEKGTLGKK
jgi:serine/threonine protein kinase